MDPTQIQGLLAVRVQWLVDSLCPRRLFFPFCCYICSPCIITSFGKNLHSPRTELLCDTFCIFIPDSSVYGSVSLILCQCWWEEAHACSLFPIVSPLYLYSPRFSCPSCFLTVNLLPPKLILSLLKTPLYPFWMHLSLCLSSHLLLPPFLCSFFFSFLLTVLNFYLDSRWGLHADRLVVSKEQRCARSVPGLSLLQAADHALTSCHLTSDLLVGDVAITQGRHYWACSVEPGSYLVKVRKYYLIYFIKWTLQTVRLCCIIINCDVSN